MKSHPDPRPIRRAVTVGLLLVVCALAVVACKLPAQLSAVQSFGKNSKLLHIACLDTNGDSRVNATDADSPQLPDMSGDGQVTDLDRVPVRQVDFALTRKCKASHADWQVGPAAAVDCAAGKGGYIVYGVGGGAVDLANRTNAAGVRWMIYEIGKLMDERGVPHQLISMAPGVDTSQPQPDAEAWAFAYFSEQLKEQPCLHLIMIGHSHGGTSVAATSAKLEQAGYTDNIALSVLIDRVTDLYAGDTRSIPQTSKVLNIYISAGEQYEGARIDQPNVENVDVTNKQAPEHGEKGGPLKPINHTTVDNSRDVLNEIIARIVGIL